MTRREAAVAPRASETGPIYDLGYRGYDGPRLGRRAAIRHALLGQPARRLRARSLRPLEGRAVGTDRDHGRARRGRWRDPGPCAGRPLALQLRQLPVATCGPILALFVAAQAPELVSSDQRNRVLPLYFSHALAAATTPSPSSAAMAAALFVLALAPLLVILFAGDPGLARCDRRRRRPARHPAPDHRRAADLRRAAGRARDGDRLVHARAAPTRPARSSPSSWSRRGGRHPGGGRPRAVSLVAPLLNPFVLLDGTRDWLFGTSIPDSPVARRRPGRCRSSDSSRRS